MIRHSAIIDDFLDHPDSFRKAIIELPMKDHLNDADGVIYPGIVEIPQDMQDHLNFLYEDMFQSKFIPKLHFARHSYESMSPPNWAHSDFNMCQWIGLLYLSPVDYPWDGTKLLRHKITRLETHPQNDDEMEVLKRDSNYKPGWDEVMHFPSRYNRLLILNARYIHAAAYKFGTNRINSRLVLTTFFDLD